MKVFVGSDHRGFLTKKKILNLLKDKNFDVTDMGMYDDKSPCDYPRIAYKVCTEVAKAKEHFGILVCMTGLGQVIAANKVRGAYAALCYNSQAAAFSRRHNNANVLVLGAKFVKSRDLSKILDAFFCSEFEGGRHLRRFKLIQAIEKGQKV